MRGHRPTANGRMACDWWYLHGFVHPASGRNLDLLIPRVDAAWMSAALEEFARWANPDRSKTIVLLVDDAGRHVVREAVANKGFADLYEMEPVLVDRCRWPIDHPGVVRGAVGFAWAAALNG